MKALLPLALLLFLGACGLTPQGRAASAALKQGVVLIKEAHFKAAMANERLRCQRPLPLVLRMADAKGNEWLMAYVQSCPEVQAVLMRLMGVVAVRQGLQLTPIAPAAP